jgi:hypothetical protein
MSCKTFSTSTLPSRATISVSSRPSSFACSTKPVKVGWADCAMAGGVIAAIMAARISLSCGQS